MRRLVVTAESGRVVHELTEEVVTIGRAAENVIVLDDPSASSRHAQLQVAGDDYRLTDLDSTNGTTVNGDRIRSVVLRASDRIRFGKVDACFECPTATEALPPLPVPEEIEALPADVSARPADFANASPFPKRRSEKDPVRTAIYAAAALAILAFLGSMAALAQMHALTP